MPFWIGIDVVYETDWNSILFDLKQNGQFGRHTFRWIGADMHAILFCYQDCRFGLLCFCGKNEKDFLVQRFHIQWIAHPWSMARGPSSSTERRLLFILLIFHFNIWLNARKWNAKFLTLVGCFDVRRKENGQMEDSFWCVNVLDRLDVWFATSENAIGMRHFWNHTFGTDIGYVMPYSLPHSVEEHQTQYTHLILKSNMPYYHSTICNDSTALACFGCSITTMRKMSNHFDALN